MPLPANIQKNVVWKTVEQKKGHPSDNNVAFAPGIPQNSDSFEGHFPIFHDRYFR